MNVRLKCDAAHLNGQPPCQPLGLHEVFLFKLIHSFPHDRKMSAEKRSSLKCVGGNNNTVQANQSLRTASTQHLVTFLGRWIYRSVKPLEWSKFELFPVICLPSVSLLSSGFIIRTRFYWDVECFVDNELHCVLLISCPVAFSTTICNIYFSIGLEQVGSV